VTRPHHTGTASLRRTGLGAAVAVVTLLVSTAVLVPLRDNLSLAGIVLLYLLPVLLTAAAGGLLPALGAAVAADLLVNWFFVPPYRTLAVETRDNLVALVVYLLVAAAAGLAVDLAAAARARQAQRIATEAARADELAQIDRLRSALLGAVGHDLRTPLAGIKIAVSSLRQPDVEFSAGDRAELLATLDESADRLTTVVDNLLAVSRLQAGVLSVEIEPTAVDAVAAAAVLGTDTAGVTVALDVPDHLPLALADAGLLERVIANLIANAVTASPPGGMVAVTGEAERGRVRLAVVDHGPGIPAAARDAVFSPFRQLDDHTGGGLGLGLAIARGFTEAQDGTLIPTDTPGGGLTMTISLPAAVPGREAGKAGTGEAGTGDAGAAEAAAGAAPDEAGAGQAGSGKAGAAGTGAAGTGATQAGTGEAGAAQAGTAGAGAAVAGAAQAGTAGARAAGAAQAGAGDAGSGKAGAAGAGAGEADAGKASGGGTGAAEPGAGGTGAGG
jgi:two-component system, OmpR family, sensor histidine kinase KdpD